uniref:Uncharacterized protein n=1 Tax=Moniliophthora roreri TaxID=221103 RepID=A0A0W0G1R2_MONRR
MPRLDQTFQAS